MARSKKIHPADLYVAAQIARSTRFSVSFRKSPFETYHSEWASLDEAKTEAARLDAEHGKNGRRAGVSAINPEGTAFPIGVSYSSTRQYA